MLAALGCVLVTAYALAFAPYASAWMGDAPRYAEAARSLLRGEPLYNTIGFDGPRPMNLWPPGFPVLIASIAASGLPVITAAYLLSCASVALLLPAVYWALYPAFGRPLALIAAALCLTGPGILVNANLVATESNFLLVAVCAFGFAIRERFFLAAFLAGISVLIRNSGMAIAPGLVLAILATSYSNRTRAVQFARTLCGIAIPILVLVAWNLRALHTLTPYVMPPSTRSLANILSDMGQALSLNLFPSVAISLLIPGVWPLLLTVGICAGAALSAFLGNQTAAARRGLAVTSCFVLAGIAMTIAGRARYEWGAEITVRHASQYAWLLLPMSAMLALQAWTPHRRIILQTAGGIAVILVLLRGWVVTDQQSFMRVTDGSVNNALASGIVPSTDAGRHLQRRQFFRHYESMVELVTLARSVNPHCALVSNLHEVLIAQYDIPALSSDLQRADGRDVVYIKGLLPDIDKKSASYLTRLAPVRTPDLPKSLHVFSSSPERCFAAQTH